MGTKYIRYSNANKEKFAELLERAKGERTMKEFAEECGVNPSTFSRIYNKVNKGASSIKLIKSIADHAAPDSKVTFDMLMEANGYLPQGYKVEGRRLQMQNELYAANVLFEGFRKLGISEVYKDLGVYKIGKSMSIRPDLVINNIMVDDNKGQWLIDMMSVPIYTDNAFKRRADLMSLRRVQERMGRYWSIYCMKEKDMNIVRISLAVYDELLYNRIIENFGGYKTDDSISFILFDLDDKVIKEEYVLKDRNDKNGYSIINKNRIIDDDDYDDSFDDIIWDEGFDK